MSKKSLASFFLFSLLFSNLAFAATAKQVNEFSVEARKLQYPPQQNERLTINALKTIYSAQMTYQSTIGAGNFGALFQLYQANLIDGVLLSGEKYGYYFAVLALPRGNRNSAMFEAVVIPRRYGKTGRRSFYINENCEVRGADKNGAMATINDPIIDSCPSSIRAENEQRIIFAMRTFHSAQMTYQATTGNGRFGSISELIQAGMISPDLANLFLSGYFIAYTVINNPPGFPSTFEFQTRPEVYARTGFRSFYIDQTGVLRGADRQGSQSEETDPPIED